MAYAACFDDLEMVFQKKFGGASAPPSTPLSTALRQAWHVSRISNQITLYVNRIRGRGGGGGGGGAKLIQGGGGGSGNTETSMDMLLIVV